MKVAIVGGSGLIGGILAPALTAQGHIVTILTRHPVINQDLPAGLKLLQYNLGKPGAWQEKAAENDVIINLAGSSIFRRWTPLSKRNILNSRILTTRKLVDLISFHQNQGKSLLSFSGAGFYGPHGDELITENVKPGCDFLAQVAEQWEAEAIVATRFGMRVVLCRVGNVLSLKGGMFPKLVTLAKYNLGCRLGSGTQWISWIHEEDLAQIILFLIANMDISGPVNLTSPNPVPNAEMMMSISRRILQAPFVPCLPGPLLRFIAGEFASAFLTGQRVIPKKLIDGGFNFKYPTLDEALARLIP